MIYQEAKYKIVTNNRYFKIIIYTLENNYKLVYEIYDKSDINYSNILTSGEGYSNDILQDAIGIDGKYTILIKIIPIDESCIIVNNDSIGYTYDFYVYEKFTDNAIKLLIDKLCICCEKNILSNCDSCKESQIIKNDYIEFVYLIFYILYYVDGINYEGFINYIRAIIDYYKVKIDSRFEKMFNYANLRGVYDINKDNEYILLTAFYVYLYLSDLQNTDYDLSIDIEYKIVDVKKCIFDKGLNYEIFEQKVFEYNYKGALSFEEINCSENTPCNEIIPLMNTFNYIYTKKDLIDGQTINVNLSNSKLIIIIPKVWRFPDNIVDDSNTNIIDVFDIMELEGYYIFYSKDIYPKGNYKIKLIYNE